MEVFQLLAIAMANPMLDNCVPLQMRWSRLKSEMAFASGEFLIAAWR